MSFTKSNERPLTPFHGGTHTYGSDASQTQSMERSATWKQTVERLFPTEESRSDFNDPTPNILLSGLPRSGKSSISRVVFSKTSPHETLYFSPTTLPIFQKITNSNFVRITLIDLPGMFLMDKTYDDVLFPKCQTLIFVIDAQNQTYNQEIDHCKDVFKRASKINPSINLEVFIHKVDGDMFTADEIRSECQRDIHDKIMSHISEEGLSTDVTFYSTSIYDHTIFEACSRVLQRLIPLSRTIEELLDALVTNCRMKQAFLIDVLSKTFIATDSNSSFDPFNYELCTDMIEVVIEISCIYGDENEFEGEKQTTDGSSAIETKKVEDIHTHTNTGEKNDNRFPMTMCLIQLTDKHVLYLKEVDRLLALACVIEEHNFDRQYLVDYNIKIFREALHALQRCKGDRVKAR